MQLVFRSKTFNRLVVRIPIVNDLHAIFNLLIKIILIFYFNNEYQHSLLPVEQNSNAVPLAESTDFTTQNSIANASGQIVETASQQSNKPLSTTLHGTLKNSKSSKNSKEAQRCCGTLSHITAEMINSILRVFPLNPLELQDQFSFLVF